MNRDIKPKIRKYFQCYAKQIPLKASPEFASKTLKTDDTVSSAVSQLP